MRSTERIDVDGSCTYCWELAVEFIDEQSAELCLLFDLWQSLVRSDNQGELVIHTTAMVGRYQYSNSRMMFVVVIGDVDVESMLL